MQAGRDGDPEAPGLLQGPADGEAADRARRRDAARAKGAASTPTRGRGSGTWRAAPLLPAERGRLARRVRWLDTATFRGRWYAANHALEPYTKDPDDETRARSLSTPVEARRARDRLLGLAHDLGADARNALVGFAQAAIADADDDWKEEVYPVLIQNALRQLIPMSPDYQTC